MRLTTSIFQRRTWTAVALAAACAFSAGSVWADDYSEVSRLMRAGQVKEASAKVDQLLAAKPKDPQLRFFKGVLQSEQGRTQEAIQTFSKLSQDYPELPEPYNNLAVLYAGQSQFDKARASLEMAIRTNPSYATAHENLGDVYAKLASQAYSKALQLDGGNAAVQPKLALIKEMFAPGTRTVRTAAPRPAATQAPVAVAPTRVVTAVPATAAPAVAVKATATSTPAVAATTAPVAVQATATPAPTAQPTVAPQSADVAAAEAAVRAWAKAWAAKDMNAYYAAYGKGFQPAGGMSRKAWEDERKARIVSKKNIRVDISNVRVNMEGADKATVRFHQDYQGDALRARANKSLAMAKEGGRWVIVRELVGR